MALIKTPHIVAEENAFAETVLMPGDPKRAKFIADTYFENPVLINDIRGVQGYSGSYNGVKVSVMASGMGMPSMGIYSYELFKFFKVKNIIRVGSAGAISPKLKLRDVVMGMGACTNSNYGAQFNLKGVIAPTASFSLLEKAVNTCRKMNIEPIVGNLFSSDTFYDDADISENWAKMGVLAVEMEAAALYMNAARLGGNALAICTISDIPGSDKILDALERQNSFTQMVEIALNMQIGG